MDRRGRERDRQTDRQNNKNNKNRQIDRLPVGLNNLAFKLSYRSLTGSRYSLTHSLARTSQTFLYRTYRTFFILFLLLPAAYALLEQNALRERGREGERGNPKMITGIIHHLIYDTPPPLPSLPSIPSLPYYIIS